MTWSIRKTLLVTALSLVILLGCFGIGILPINLFLLKNTISDIFQQHTGAGLTIDGPLRLRLGLQPELTARNIMIDWHERSDVASIAIETLSIRTRLASVLRKQIDLTGMHARGVELNLRQSPFSDLMPKEISLEGSAPLDRPVTAGITASVLEQPWEFSLEAASLDELLTAEQEYLLSAGLALPGTHLQFDGAVLLPWDQPGLAGELTMQSEDASKLLQLAGQEVPGLGPLSTRSAIQLTGSAVQLEDLEGMLGDFSFTLSALVRDWSERPWFELTAEVPAINPGMFPTIRQSDAATPDAGSANLQPVFDALSELDGRVDIHIGRIQHPHVPVQQLTLSANLERGHLSVDNAKASIFGTTLTAQALLDVTSPCARLDTSVHFSRLDLQSLAPLLEKESELEGVLEDGRVSTSSCGSSLNGHIGTLETRALLADLEIKLPDNPDPLQIRNLDAGVSQLLPGRLSFDSELIGEPLSVSLGFGSLQQMSSDQLWPVTLNTRTHSMGLNLTGHSSFNETGLILDLELAARLGGSDITGQLSWGGTASGLPLNMDFSSNLLDLRDFDILFPESDQDESGSLHDWGEILDETELIEEWLAIPSIDVNLRVEQLQGTPYEAGKMHLTTHLEDHQLVDGRMGLEFEGVQMEGLINADMRGPSTLLDYQVSLKNLDIGRLMRSMELSDNVDAHVERAGVHITSEGATLREIGRNMVAKIGLQALQWSFTAGPEDRRFHVNLSDVRVLAHPREDTVWETSGTLDGFPIQAWLRTPNLRQTFDETAPLPARFILSSRNGITMLDLTVYPVVEDEHRSEIQISSRYASEEAFDFAALPSPLEDFFFRTELTVKKGEYLASDIEARIESSKVAGRFKINPSGQGFHFDLELDSPFIETDDLVRWVKEFREARELISDPGATKSEDSQMTAGLVTLIDQYVEEFIGDNSWHIRADTHELHSGGTLLGDAELELRMDGQEIALEPATIRLPGGDVDVRYSSQQEGAGWDYNLDIFIERLEYGGLLRLLDPETTANGEIHVDTSLHSRSDDVTAVANHLQGSVDLALFPEDIGAQFLDLWASNLVLALLPLGDNQKKKLNCMVARFDVEEGVMKSRNTFLDSTDIIVRARGDIDLANRQLDLLAVPQAKTERFLSVSTPIEVTGPFDDFKVGVASGGFIKTMIRWYYGLIYVPWKWLTGERYPKDGIETCFRAMDWETPTEAR